nr:hypothetical protein [Lacticaseibacillus paracasei]
MLLDITVTTIEPQNENDDPGNQLRVNGILLNTEKLDKAWVEQNASGIRNQKQKSHTSIGLKKSTRGFKNQIRGQY